MSEPRLQTRDVLPLLDRMETLAEEILTHKQQAIDFDVKRQANREALSRITKDPKLAKSKLWLASGTDMFIRLPAPQIVEQLQGEQKRVEEEIQNLQKQVKEKTLELYELQGDTETMAGFSLNALTPEEFRMFNKPSEL